MLKTLSQLECVIGERKYQFLCDPNSPLVEAKEALFQFTKYIGQIEDAAMKAAQEKAKQEADSKESIIEDIEIV